MRLLPGGLVDGQSRARCLQVVGACDWYVVEAGRFDFVGNGEVSEEDLGLVGRELADGAFVCVRQPRPIEEVLGDGKLGTRRLRFASKLRSPGRPRLRWVARGARVAVLPGRGAVWVDGEHLFEDGEEVSLPWTSPLVSLAVIRPPVLYKELRRAVGPNGPGRAFSIHDRS